MAASSFAGRWMYDVFVSFRGEDVRKSFMDHLFNDFKRKGIRAFRDDSELPKGEVISHGLYEAIELSRFLIVIFSKNYAFSSWCLRELVKILECKEMGEPKPEVRIIFYDVKPDVVRNQTESYTQAFAKHESLKKKTEVAKWKKALTMAADLSGWDLEDLTNGYQAKFIESISSDIFKKLCVGPLDVGENIVGVDAHVEELNLLCLVGSNKVHMIGICGISGIGKTTLAMTIYNLMYTHYEGSCFCEDVQQQGITHVQKKLIDKIMKTEAAKISTTGEGIRLIKQTMASKRILLVFDNVNNQEQIEALAGSPDWFGKGSFIIFTSQNRQLLKSHQVDAIYDMPVLPYHEAFELFRLHAFGQQHPTDVFEDLAYQVVEYLQGHPLALKVIGRCLYGKAVNVWKSQLDRLQIYPNADIRKKLRPSIDGLDFDQKRTFLDIACSFIGENKDFVVNVLHDSDCFAEANIDFLVDKSLITISPHDVSLQMHELIRSMAREIVREEHNMHGNRSRLWGPSKEVYDVLSNNKATKAVEVIDLLKEKSKQKFNINGEAFAPMENLRILRLPKDHNVNFSGRLKYLSNNLRYLSWHGFPFKLLPSDFYPENIVAIDLSYSHIKSLWTTPKRFTRLKIMKLKHCRNLISTPDFTQIINLEELILEGCVNLIKIHPSIGMLERLIVLNLSHCLKVDNLLQAVGRIKSLVELHIDQSVITILSSFLFSLPNLIISLFGRHECFKFRGLSIIAHHLFLHQSSALSSLGGLRLLRELDLSNCNILQVPESIGGLSCLEELYLGANNFTALPGSLIQLFRLQLLELDGCKMLELLSKLPPSIEGIYASYCNVLQVPENIGGLSCLKHLSLRGNNFTSLPRSLSQLSSLERLVLDGCKRLEVLPELPPSIIWLSATNCDILQAPKNIGGLSCLESLYLAGNTFISFPGSLSQLSRIERLGLDGSKKLEVLPELPPSIKKLYALDCNILQVPEDIGGLSSLKYLYVNGNNFISLPGSLSQLSSFQMITRQGYKKLKVLPELPPSIIWLYACDCPKLVRKVRVESHKAQPLETSITSYDSIPKMPSLLQYIQSNICEFFLAQEPDSRMEMAFNGNRIPEWYTNKSMGSELKVELPPGWCFTKFKGYAVCVLFTPKKFKSGIKLDVNNFDGTWLYDYHSSSNDIGRSTDESAQKHGSDMIWLLYVTNKWGWWDKAKYNVTFSFKGSRNEEDVKVKKCGVRLICDEEDLHQAMDSSLITYLPTSTQDGGYFLKFIDGKSVQINW